MATYSITEDTKSKWVKVITIHSDDPINIDSESFNITVKEQFEYFINDYLADGDTFAIEELYKKDTEPTIEICKNAREYKIQNCFSCGGTGEITCPDCGGIGILYPPRNPSIGCKRCGGHGSSDVQSTFVPGKGIIECPTCEGTGEAHTICGNETMYDQVFVNSIQTYYNSNDYSLIKNGIQFWLDDNKTLIIRIVTKGKSNANVDGYKIYNPITHHLDKTGFVGFCIANFNITLNDSENLLFDCALMPRVDTDDPVTENPVFKPHVVPDGYDRVDFDWNCDGNGLNNLYVNNTSSFDSSAYEYKQAYNNTTHKWFTEGPKQLDNSATPLYVVKSSAFTNDYLLFGETYDLINGGMSAREFDFVKDNVKSTLYDEYTDKYIKLPFEFEDEQKAKDIIYYGNNSDYISGTVYWHEITQTITNTADHPGKIRKNQVKLELEI